MPQISQSLQDNQQLKPTRLNENLHESSAIFNNSEPVEYAPDINENENEINKLL